jgi:ATP-dependent exoDNAse (exonuclease V) beta subunit
MFLEGAAGTGKTFTFAALVAVLRGEGQRCLICGTTGIAAVQYPGGCTLHSLFKLGID